MGGWGEAMAGSFRHAVMIAGLGALGAIVFFAFGCWLHRMGVFAVARRLLWSVRGAFLALALFGFILWAGTKPNLGLGPLPQVGDGEPNAAEHVISPEQVEAGFALAHAGTNETWDFSAPAGVSEHAPWRLRGANRNRFALASDTNAPWAFMLGTNVIDGFSVSSSGMLVPKFAGERYVPHSRNFTFFAPLFADLGAVPMVNWAAAGVESGFWWTSTPSNSVVLTWHDFLYNRDPSTPVSFQAEFFWNGDFIYRYDLSRCGGRGATALPDGIISNALAGAFNGGYGECAEPATNLTSLLYRRVEPADLLDAGLDISDLHKPGHGSARDPSGEGCADPDGVHCAEVVFKEGGGVRDVGIADLKAHLGELVEHALEGLVLSPRYPL